jgi:2-succinyl-6-hydroxy-2,4-cyclohexadiene-1-carboxylate synthase
MKIWGLHGFLGRPEDFSSLELPVEAPDHLKIPSLSPSVSLNEWGRNFCSQAVADQNILIGYSQGGRLALQALKANPKQWKHVILLSTNLGLPIEQRSSRIENDKNWAEKFLREDFEECLKAWNQQNVFKGSVNEPVRTESDYTRKDLADCLMNWSLGHQEDFRPFLKSCEIPISFFCGEFDTKYQLIGDEIEKLNPNIKKTVIPNSGHRLLFDQPLLLRTEILKTLGLGNFFAGYKSR